MNGDGLADLALAAPYVGVIYVVFGRRGPGVLDTSAGSPGGYVIGVAYSVGSIAGAGDVNGDGRADLIIGAAGAQAHDGEAWVVFGKGDSAPVNLAGLGSAGFSISGTGWNPGDQVYDPASGLGTAVAPAGDFNGDGLADVVVGAPGYQNWAGTAYVVFGSRSPAPVVLTRLGSGGLVVFGDHAARDPHDIDPGDTDSSRLGTTVAGGTDLNQDGLDDVVLGTVGLDSPLARNHAGAAYVVLGGAAGAIRSGSAGSRSVRFTGAGAESRAGDLVTSIGDIDADGRPDLAFAFDDPTVAGGDLRLTGLELPALELLPASGAPAPPAPTAVIDSHGRVTLRLRCRGYERACTGRAELILQGRHGGRAARSLRIGAAHAVSVRFRLPSGVLAGPRRRLGRLRFSGRHPRRTTSALALTLTHR